VLAIVIVALLLLILLLLRRGRKHRPAPERAASFALMSGRIFVRDR
jgi:hypothetical protein